MNNANKDKPTNNPHQDHNVVIYGGNGFIGSNIAQEFAKQGYAVTCVSRTGKMPIHLQRKRTENNWANNVNWLKGDASKPDITLLKKASIVITTIGSPPIPTLSKAGYDAQYYANGEVNIQLLNECAQEQTIKHLIIIGAQIPAILNRPSFAYAKGKQAVVTCATALTQSSDTKVTILQPSMVYGLRHTKRGFPIPLGLFSLISGLLKRFCSISKLTANNTLTQLAPVPVEKIATLCVESVNDISQKNDNPHFFTNHEILYE